MTISEHTSLKRLTTFKVGGEARYFVSVTSIEELKAARAFADVNKLAVFILGGGSNILISDQGFPGLVIQVKIAGIEYVELNVDTVELVAGAGVVWDDLVAYSVAKELYGLETLSLIPGSVGAAPVQNVGAYGAEAKDTIAWVEVFNMERGESCVMKKNECGFNYRDSIFKKPEGKKYVITRVAFHLKKSGMPNTSYKDIKNYLEKNNLANPTLQDIRNIVIEIRTKKLPDLARFGTAGSFFKNPVVTQEKYNGLVQLYPLMPQFSAGEGKVKVLAAWILDNVCGFKGYRDGNVGVYENQALVIVNFGNATADEIKILADKMISCVKEKTGIILEREVEYV